MIVVLNTAFEKGEKFGRDDVNDDARYAASLMLQSPSNKIIVSSKVLLNSTGYKQF